VKDRLNLAKEIVNFHFGIVHRFAVLHFVNLGTGSSLGKDFQNQWWSKRFNYKTRREKTLRGWMKTLEKLTGGKYVLVNFFLQNKLS